MKTYQSWFLSHKDIRYSRDAEIAWDVCASVYEAEIKQIQKELNHELFNQIQNDNERLKKELHDMAGKIQSAQLRAEVAERKLKDALADNEALKHELFTLQDKIRLKYHGEDDYSEEIK